MRRIFIGDIHGCLGPLEDLLAAVSYVPGQDQLFPVGDLVNKGPSSMGVLRLLMLEGAQCVLGNHDLAWLRRGRIEDPQAEAWLRAQPMARVLLDIIVIHGGLHPRWSEADLSNLCDQDADYAANLRYCDSEGNRPAEDWPPPPAPFRPWHEFYAGSKTVVFGHWARQGLLRRDRLVGLDTACVYGGQLSAWIAEEDRIVQVPGL